MTDLSAAQQKLILHFGEMGARWGVNRTVAQIHALLYLSPGPMTAEEIAKTLSVARSNVSTSLKVLQSWHLVNVEHELGDRRDHYASAMNDVWDLFKVVIEGRKQRELDPTRTVLHECLQEIDEAEEPDAYTRERLQEMVEFVDTMAAIYEQVRGMPKEQLEKLIKTAGKLHKFLGILG